ncbi:MAG TPA: GNAT family N-acetyltransferase [Gammaproteobacteria bacterium]|nr:GNAT family N-acetyltransferase [Gammaproteobacteria bacterium]
MNNSTFTVREATWAEDSAALRAIRQRVFVEEQNVPPELEWDETDAQCLHALAIDPTGNAIGCGRLLDGGKIGRMAVLPEWRDRGVGSALLRFLIDIAQSRGCTECRLDAQIRAMGFYHRHGFTAEGEEFLDANIPHRHMRLTLPM